MVVASKRRAKKQAEICRVFANPTRILILWALADGEKSVGELAQTVNASLQSTSQHLRMMRQMKIVVSQRKGQMVYYQIANGTQPVACRLLLEAAPRQAEHVDTE
jgi:DNA-binding transcriptional ArsR family regulator